MDKISGWIVLLPAYGRDYKNRKAVLEDFNNNKDFIITHFGRNTYINKEQIETGTNIEFRYNTLRSVFVHKVKE